MKAAQTYVPTVSEKRAFWVFIAVSVLADGFLVAWATDNQISLALTGGAIAGLAVAIAWTARRDLPGTATSVFVLVTGMVVLLGRSSVKLGLSTTAVTLIVWGVWLRVFHRLHQC